MEQQRTEMRSITAEQQKRVEEICFRSLALIGRNCEYLEQHFDRTLVALESNYDLHMLRSGPYPYYLRARIESVRGHLSNDECSAKLLELIQSGCKKFALCHLSQENNTPSLALQTVFTTLGAAGVVPEKDCIVQAQRRNEVSPALEF